MGMALGVRHVQGLFLLPITMNREWSRETFSFAMAVQNLSWGLAQPFTGMMADRFGSAKVMFGGLVFYALGLFLMTNATTSAAFVWSAGVCIGVALSGTSFGAVYGALSRLVPPERRSWALGLAGAIGGFGQFAMVPAAQELIGSWSWSRTLIAFSLIMCTLLPLAWLFKDRSAGLASEHAEISMSAAIKEAFAQRGFWLLNIGFLACGFQLAFIATHLPAYLLDKGLHPSDAVAALAIIALANIFGAYCFGLLGARYRRKYLLAGIYLLRTAAIALFLISPVAPWTCTHLQPSWVSSGWALSL